MVAYAVQKMLKTMWTNNITHTKVNKKTVRQSRLINLNVIRTKTKKGIRVKQSMTHKIRKHFFKIEMSLIKPSSMPYLYNESDYYV